MKVRVGFVDVQVVGDTASAVELVTAVVRISGQNQIKYGPIPWPNRVISMFLLMDNCRLESTLGGLIASIQGGVTQMQEIASDPGPQPIEPLSSVPIASSTPARETPPGENRTLSAGGIAGIIAACVVALFALV